MAENKEYMNDYYISLFHLVASVVLVIVSIAILTISSVLAYNGIISTRAFIIVDLVVLMLGGIGFIVHYGIKK